MSELTEPNGTTARSGRREQQTPPLELVRCCELCGSSETRSLGVNRDRYLNQPGEFGLVRCHGCGLVRLSPRPSAEALLGYYPPDEYYSYKAPQGTPVTHRRKGSRARDELRAAGLWSLDYPIVPASWWARRVARKLPRQLVRRAAYNQNGFPRWVPGGRALDIGCGSGRFLSLLRRYGWDVVGVDISPAAATAAQAAYGIVVHVGELDQVPLEENSFDFVHMSHVIEHVAHPVATLQRVAALLRPGGRLYIETPNIESIGFRWCRTRWFPLETPRHLWLFSPATLQAALRQAGLSDPVLHTRGFPSYAWEATYRQEERQGRVLARRPSMELRSLPRAASLASASRLLRWVRPELADILCCWAVGHPE